MIIQKKRTIEKKVFSKKKKWKENVKSKKNNTEMLFYNLLDNNNVCEHKSLKKSYFNIDGKHIPSGGNLIHFIKTYLLYCNNHMWSVVVFEFFWHFYYLKYRKWMSLFIPCVSGILTPCHVVSVLVGHIFFCYKMWT